MYSFSILLKSIFLSFLIVCVIIVGSCVEEKVIILANNPSESLYIETLATLSDQYFSEDTFLVGPNQPVAIKFRANIPDGIFRHDIEWFIGNDPRRFLGESEVDLYFDYDDLGEITVTIKTKAFDDTPKVASSAFNLVENSDSNLKFLGSFEGYDQTKPLEKFVVNFVDFGPRPVAYNFDLDIYGYRVYNLNQGCGGSVLDSSKLLPKIQEYSQNHLYIESYPDPETSCDGIVGFGEFISEDSLKIIYQSTDFETFQTQEKTFIGVRIE